VPVGFFSAATDPTAMDVDCAGCAGCCIDWRPLTDTPHDHERRGPRRPLDDTYNLVPLTRDDVTDLLAAGYADALTPRLWRATDDPTVTVDGVDLAAIDGRPAFFLGLRTPPKPVAPFDTEPTWLHTCVFLDPTTLQCRIHDTDLYPTECGAYPAHNLDLGAETECERVEDAFGGTRLRDRSVPPEVGPRLLGPQAIGHTVFAYPDPTELEGVIEDIAARTIDPATRARFVAVAAASAPGTVELNDDRFAEALATARTARSWAGAAIDDWTDRADTSAADPSLAAAIEDDRGAPGTPGWD